MQRIAISDSGVTITFTTPALISMYGTEMRPGSVDAYELPWDEVSVISVSVTEIPAAGWRSVHLTVDLTWGEFIEVDETAEGFADTLAKLSRLSGVVVPELATVTALDLELWHRPVD